MTEQKDLSKMSPQLRFYYRHHKQELKRAKINNDKRRANIPIKKCQCGCGQNTFNKFAFGHYMKIHGTGKNNPACKLAVRKKLRLENHWNWKGGKRFDCGYMTIKMPKHPYALKNGYIMEHRYIMEQKIGRYLKKDEVVHHKHNCHHAKVRNSLGRFVREVKPQ